MFVDPISCFPQAPLFELVATLGAQIKLEQHRNRWDLSLGLQGSSGWATATQQVQEPVLKLRCL